MTYDYEDQIKAMHGASYGMYSGLRSVQDNPLNGIDVSRIPTDELKAMMKYLQDDYERRTMDTPLPSPTLRQLKADETLARAYEELAVIMKLKGIK